MLRLVALRERDLFRLGCRDDHRPLFAGVDLGLPHRRTTGVALLCCRCRTIWTTQTTPTVAIALCTYLRPDLAAVDAPLSLPRRGTERGIEKISRALGYRLIPPLLGSMRRLTKTGMLLAETLERANVKVVETHPRSALQSAGIVDLMRIVAPVRSGRSCRLTRHMIDAAISSIVAAAYYFNLHVALQDSEKGSLILLSRSFVRKCLKIEK